MSDTQVTVITGNHYPKDFAQDKEEWTPLKNASNGDKSDTQLVVKTVEAIDGTPDFLQHKGTITEDVKSQERNTNEQLSSEPHEVNENVQGSIMDENSVSQSPLTSEIDEDLQKKHSLIPFYTSIQESHVSDNTLVKEPESSETVLPLETTIDTNKQLSPLARNACGNGHSQNIESYEILQSSEASVIYEDLLTQGSLTSGYISALENEVGDTTLSQKPGPSNTVNHQETKIDDSEQFSSAGGNACENVQSLVMEMSEVLQSQIPTETSEELQTECSLTSSHISYHESEHNEHVLSPKPTSYDSVSNQETISFEQVTAENVGTQETEHKSEMLVRTNNCVKAKNSLSEVENTSGITESEKTMSYESVPLKVTEISEDSRLQEYFDERNPLKSYEVTVLEKMYISLDEPLQETTVDLASLSQEKAASENVDLENPEISIALSTESAETPEMVVVLGVDSQKAVSNEKLELMEVVDSTEQKKAFNEISVSKTSCQKETEQLKKLQEDVFSEEVAKKIASGDGSEESTSEILSEENTPNEIFNRNNVKEVCGKSTFEDISSYRVNPFEKLRYEVDDMMDDIEPDETDSFDEEFISANRQRLELELYEKELLETKATEEQDVKEVKLCMKRKSDCVSPEKESIDMPCKKKLFSSTTEETIAYIYDRLQTKPDHDEQSIDIPMEEPDEPPVKKFVWKRIPPGRYMPVTSESQNRVYVKLRPTKYFETESFHLECQRATRLLSMPYDDLHREAEIVREQIRLKCREEELPDSLLNISEGSEKRPEEDLWVEKYKPSCFMDLLSDDGTNRTLLHWLKLWDKAVFNKNPPNITKPNTKTDFSKFSNPIFTKPNPYEVIKELDENGFPLQKVALLCGPPGLGKTTLAHVLAKHAGYNPVEMNASDDRSADAFYSQIEAATQMKSVMGLSPRPNCLVIDEIDGAPVAAINVLVSIATGKKATGKDKKKSKGIVLLRPIICICNDLYVPALRPLRQISVVLPFPPVLKSRLSFRLFNILQRQNHRVDQTLLSALCDKAQNDIRSCLSTLQFLCSRKGTMFSYKDIDSIAVGHKDVQQTLFEVWRQIFVIPRPVRKVLPLRSENNVVFESTSPPADRFTELLRMLQSCGEYDKLFQGLFDNYFTATKKEPDMELVSEGTDWLQFVDEVNTQILRGQNFNLWSYLPYAGVQFHYLFATHDQNPTFQYQNSHYECITRQNQTANIVSAVGEDMMPKIRIFTNSSCMVTEVLPYLLTIVQPSLRPVNTQLYSSKEKDELSQLVHTMIAYNLTYTQMKKPEDAQYSYVFEPNIEEVVCFPAVKLRQSLTYAAKQLIAHEIQLDKMRRSEPCIETKLPKKSEKSVLLPNHKQTLEPKLPVKPLIDRPALDFFGRPVTLPKKYAEKQEDSCSGGMFWFKFKEGFSNAVRRNIKVDDFLK